MTKYIILFCLILFMNTNVHARSITLTPENSINFIEVITDKSYEDFKAELQTKNKKKLKYLVIYSPGGSLDYSLTLIELLKEYPNIQTVNIWAASGASALIQGIPGKRLIGSKSSILFHEARVFVEGWFRPSDVYKFLLLFSMEVSEFNKVNYDRLGLTEDQYLEKINGTDWILKGNEILENNAADEMVEIKCSPELRNLKLNIKHSSGLPWLVSQCIKEM